MNAIHALSQLSYVPMFSMQIAKRKMRELLNLTKLHGRVKFSPLAALKLGLSLFEEC